MKYPFEATFEELESDLDQYVATVVSSLESDFLEMPKGEGFIDYPTFERGYEVLKQATASFTQFDADSVLPVAFELPISVVVLRSMLGFTPSEWAYVASERTGMLISQGCVRAIDRKIRKAPWKSLKAEGITAERLKKLIVVACQLLVEGAPASTETTLHRLAKADTQRGLPGMQSLARLGVPYAMLLYERFLGRPFASHRDSVSELIGDLLESAIEDALNKADISFRKTRRAEKIEGFDQTPDFIVPDEFSPAVVIEAKITEDDGTARDKITRIQHLAALGRADQPGGEQKFQVVACIGGRGFSVRRQDMKKMLLETHGKVFTLKTLDRLVECTRLREFRAKRAE
jgi:hypothetical protein